MLWTNFVFTDFARPHRDVSLLPAHSSQGRPTLLDPLKVGQFRSTILQYHPYSRKREAHNPTRASLYPFELLIQFSLDMLYLLFYFPVRKKTYDTFFIDVYRSISIINNT